MKEANIEDLLAAYVGGAPGLEWDFDKILPDGEKVKTKLRIQVLTVKENLEALAAAQKSAKSLGELPDYGDVYREAQAHEVLVRCIRTVKKHERPDGTSYYPPLFLSADQLRANFNEMELAVLLNCYQATKAEFSSLESLGAHDAETWIAKLSDPLRGKYFLSQLDSLHWPAMIQMLAGVSRDLYTAAGLPLPSLDDTSASSQPNSTSDTGSLPPPPVASSTSDVQIDSAKLLTADEAAEIVRRRTKKKPSSQ